MLDREQDIKIERSLQPSAGPNGREINIRINTGNRYDLDIRRDSRKLLKTL